jgi:hypothetical protein
MSEGERKENEVVGGGRASEGDSLWKLFDSALFDSSTSAPEIELPRTRLPCAAPARLPPCPTRP